MVRTPLRYRMSGKCPHVPVMFLSLWCVVMVLASCSSTAAAREETVSAALREGQACLDAKQYAEAARIYALALEDVPSDTRLLYNLGVAFALDGVYDRSLDSFGRLLDIAPNNTKYLGAHAGVALAAGRADEAAEDWETILVLDPYDAEARLRLIRLYLDRGDGDAGYRHAISAYEQRQYSPELFNLLAELEVALEIGNGSSWRLLAEETD